MNKQWAIILAGISILVSTCQATPTVLPVPIYPLNPSSTPKSTVLPSTEPSPIPTLSSRAPLPSDSFSYSLQPPASNQLLSIIDLVWKRDDEIRFQSSDEFATSAIVREVSAIDRLLSADLDHYYPYGIPGGSQFAEKVVPAWRDLFFYPSDSIEKLLVASTVQYLNDQHVQFFSQQKLSTQVFTALPIPVELDGDPQPEWLVQIDYTEYQIRAFLLLNVTADGTYHILPNDIPMINLQNSDDSFISLDTTHDLNGDGIDDLVIASQHYLAGSMSGQASVFSWNGKGLLRIGSVDLPGVNPRADSFISEYAIANRPDKSAEIRVVWPRFRSFGCNWTTEYIYRWTGTQFTKSSLHNAIPDKPDCYIAQALESDQPREQVRWLQSALAQIKTGNATSDLKAWLLLRFAVAYSAQGRDSDAERTLKTLIGASETGNFLKAVIDTYSRVGPEPLLICKSLHATASDLARSQSSFNSTIDGDLAFDFVYPISSSPVPDMVCPYWELLKNQIKAKKIVSNTGPVQALSMSGYQFKLLQVQNLDSDAAVEYIGVLQPEKPLIVAVDAVANGWQIYPIDFVDQPVVGMELATTLVADSVEPRTLLLAQLDTSTRRETTDCMKNTQDYLLILAAGEKEGYKMLKWRGFSCQIQPPVDLQTKLGKDKFFSLVNECDHCDLMNDYYKVQPEWVKLQGFREKPQVDIDVFGYIDSIDQEVLDGVNLNQTRTKIARLIDYLPDNVPAAHILHNHLRYLFALSYELDGKPAQAVTEYLALIQAAPDTLWARLAWARLLPNPIKVP
jgi:hypothetical protein